MNKGEQVRAGIKQENAKILLYMKAVGEVQTLPRQKFKLDGSETLIEVERFLRKNLNIPLNQFIYLFCGSGFSPSIDQNLQDLYDNFSIGGELVISYGIQEMWG